MVNDGENLPQLPEIVRKDAFIIRNARSEDCAAIVRYIKVRSLLLLVHSQLIEYMVGAKFMQECGPSHHITCVLPACITVLYFRQITNSNV